MKGLSATVLQILLVILAVLPFQADAQCGITASTYACRSGSCSTSICGGYSNGCWFVLLVIESFALSQIISIRCDDACFAYSDCCCNAAPVCFYPKPTSISPVSAPTSGSRIITITGSQFYSYSSSQSFVQVDGTTANVAISSWSTTQVVFTLPAASGAGASSTIALNNRYTPCDNRQTPSSLFPACDGRSPHLDP